MLDMVRAVETLGTCRVDDEGWRVRRSVVREIAWDCCMDAVDIFRWSTTETVEWCFPELPGREAVDKVRAFPATADSRLTNVYMDGVRVEESRLSVSTLGRRCSPTPAEVGLIVDILRSPVVEFTSITSRAASLSTLVLRLKWAVEGRRTLAPLLSCGDDIGS